MEQLAEVLKYHYRVGGVPSVIDQLADAVCAVATHKREREAGLIAAVNGWERGKLPKIEVREL